MRVTIGNLKGGAAKSTTAVFLAAGLGRTGRVLLVEADATNQTALAWLSAASDWPAGITVVGWEVPDLARRIHAVERDYDHIVVDTGPQKPSLLRQALMVTDDLLVAVAPSPLELQQLAPTFDLAAEVDAAFPIYDHVLLCKVRSGTRSAVEARGYLTECNLSVLDAEIHLWEAYSLAYGTLPGDLREYTHVLTELNALAGPGGTSEAA